jgi:hypothetical protein
MKATNDGRLCTTSRAISSGPDGLFSYIREIRTDIAVFFGCTLLYYIAIARHFYDVAGREGKLSWWVVEWTPNRYVVRVVAPSDGYLLNLENYNPYWTVRVDGKPQDILRANFIMKAIKLARGEHVVEWRYDPAHLKVGLLAFYTVFAAVLAFPFSGMRDHPPVLAAKT